MNYNKLSLSNLSLIMLNKENSKEVRNAAEKEIQRRFKGTSCEFEQFREYEQRSIDKRGTDKENYLIGNNPSMQQLMDIYFRYVADRIYLDNILFSELHFCNNDCRNAFFSTIVDLEYERINERLENHKTDINSMETLMLVEERLRDRQDEIYVFKSKEGAGSNFIYDIMLDANFKTNLKILKKVCELFEADYEALKFDKSFGYDSIDSIKTLSENLELAQINAFLKSDFRRLKNQKRILLNDLQTGNPVNYESDSISKVLYKK